MFGFLKKISLYGVFKKSQTDLSRLYTVFIILYNIVSTEVYRGKIGFIECEVCPSRNLSREEASTNSHFTGENTLLVGGKPVLQLRRKTLAYQGIVP